MNEQEISMTIGALNYLVNLKILSLEDFDLLKEYYINGGRPFNQVKDEIIALANDKVKRDGLLNSIKVKPSKISKVTDFKKDFKSYIKVDYDSGVVRVFENSFGESGEAIFDVIKQQHEDATKVFEGLLTNFVEISLYDFRNVENKDVYERLSYLEKQSLYLVISDERYKGRQVLCSPTESIYIVRDEEDKLIQVDSNNGIYQVREMNDDSNYGIENSKQKRLGTSPLSGGMVIGSNDEKSAGFMNTLFFVFLTGLSTGIVGMILMNLFMK